MKRAGVVTKSLSLISTMLILLTVSILPTSAFADQASSQTAQLLPPGQNTCPSVTVTSFTPYIYDGELNSFDMTLSDASYVAVLGTVGNTSIPFKFMTRMADASGALRMHVDVTSTFVDGSLPVSITLLSADNGKTCMTVVSASLSSSGTVSSGGSTGMVTPPSTGTGTVTPPPTNTGNTGSTGGTGTPTGSTESSGAGTPTTATSGSASSTVGGNVSSTLNKICTTQGGAVRLWTVLLAVFLLIVAATLLAQPPVAPTSQSTTLLVLAIVVPLVVLLGVWYGSTACRVGGLWIPLVSIVIAVIGLVIGLRNHPSVAKAFATPK